MDDIQDAVDRFFLHDPAAGITGPNYDAVETVEELARSDPDAAWPVIERSLRKRRPRKHSHILQRVRSRTFCGSMDQRLRRPYGRLQSQSRREGCTVARMALAQQRRSASTTR